MDRSTQIKQGMEVYTAGEKRLGTVERVEGDNFDVAGWRYTREMVGRVRQNRIYLLSSVAEPGAEPGKEAMTAQGEGEMRVPVMEERLTVGKREVDLGEVAIRKTVTEEQQTVPVTLTHDEVRFAERAVAERPATGDDLFQEGTIRVQLRGEEAVVAKEAVVTGEVVIDKDTVAEERQITDTVRKQHVDVEENYRQARAELEQGHAARAGGTGRAFAEAEPDYRTGFEAAHDERYSGREFAEVEPEIQRDYATRGVDADRWTTLRQEIQEGWNKAREQRN